MCAHPTDFQLKYAPRAWKQERLVWTTVVQLNLIRNVNNILDVITQEIAIHGTARVESPPDVVSPAHDLFSEKHKILKLRLAPLRGVQADLERKLGSGAFEDLGNHGRVRSQSTSAAVIAGTSDPNEGDLYPRRAPKEFYIRSNNTWKDRLRQGVKIPGRPSSGGSIHDAPGAWGGNQRELSFNEWGKGSDPDDITSIVAGCREDMKTLWEDGVVQRFLSKKKYRVDESSGLCVLLFPQLLRGQTLTRSLPYPFSLFDRAQLPERH